MTAFVGKSANALVSLQDHYRLTYQLTGNFFGLDSALNASAIEQRLYTTLPQIGLVARSIPQATTGDVVVVLRVQPLDQMVGLTVGQMADRADLSAVDFTLGFNFLLGINVELSKVEYLGAIGSNSVVGTGTIDSDSEAKEKENQDAKEGDLFSQLIKAMQGVGIILLVVGAAYLYMKSDRR